LRAEIGFFSLLLPHHENERKKKRFRAVNRFFDSPRGELGEEEKEASALQPGHCLAGQIIYNFFYAFNSPAGLLLAFLHGAR
jgi:hypothetical protein